MAAKRQLGEVLSAFEFLDAESLAITLAHLPGAKDPLPACQVGCAVPQRLVGRLMAALCCAPRHAAGRWLPASRAPGTAVGAQPVATSCRPGAHLLPAPCRRLHPPLAPLPPRQAPFYLVVETSGSHAAHDAEKLERFLEGVMGEGLVLGG